MAVGVLGEAQPLGIDPDDESSIVKASADLMDQWGVGNAECDDGITILLSLGDRKVGIFAGKGAKVLMTNRVRARIIKKVCGV